MKERKMKKDDKGLDPNNYRKRMMISAWREFQSHVISKEIGPGHWLLQRMVNDGLMWDWSMAAEIVVLMGKVLVSGDLYPVVFAYFTHHDPAEVIHWMGKNRDVGYYVAQKAEIGLREVATEWDSDVAKFQLNEKIEERILEIKNDLGEDIDPSEAIEEDNDIRVLRESINDYLYEGKSFLMEYLSNNIEGFWDDSECYTHIGDVIAPRVFFAHAALARLSVLLDL